MARASILWVGVALGVAVGVNGSLGQTEPRPAQGPGALNSGIDSYRRADYETADKFFRQAQESAGGLSADERQELANLLRLNSAALKARRDGTEQLRQAERALQAGQTAEAEALLKPVMTNQFLTPGDKEKVSQIVHLLHGEPMVARAAGENTNYILPIVLARTKLQQARQLMAKANYEAAEALATEAEQIKAEYRPGEDTPQRVLDDIARIRSDAKKLLVSARVAYQCGDLDHAESLAKAAEKASPTWALGQLWGDSPAKVLKEVQAARKRQAQAAAKKAAAAKAATPAEQVAAADKSAPKEKAGAADAKATQPAKATEAAHDLVKQGRAAQHRGDLVKAKECADKALALKGTFHWWEDNPSNLARDVQRALAKDGHVVVKEQVVSSSKDTPAPVADGGKDPKTVLKTAREAFKAGQLDEAEKLALEARSAKKDWGLFEDSPDTLLKEIRNAHVKRDQEEAVRLLAEARKLLEKGDYEAAKTMARRAERLHGPYGMLDLGDRPERLLADANAAQAKNPKKEVHAAGAQVVKKDEDKPPTGGATNSPKPDAPPGFIHPETLQQAAGSGAVAKATEPSPQAAPPAVVPEGQVAASATTESAHQLLAEARQLQRENKLTEARQKALEAQKLGATWGPDEDQPERALVQLADLASRRIEHLTQHATDLAATASVDPGRFRQAEDTLIQARQLAVGFALDTQAIDAKMSWVQRMRSEMAAAPAAAPVAASEPAPPMFAQAPAAGPVQAQPPAPNPQEKNGRELLEKARLELQRGELETARHLAVEVYSGPFGLQAEADAVLHSIDAAEFNRKIHAANRTFEAGVNAFAQKQYPQSLALLKATDGRLLPPEKQAKLKELLAAKELQPQVVAPESAPLFSAPAAAPAGAAQPVANAQPAQPPATNADVSYGKQVQALQEVQFQKLRAEGLDVQQKATERFRNGETGQALDMLQDYLNTLQDSQLDPERIALLQRPVESRLQGFKKLKAQQDFDKERTGQQVTFNNVRQREAQLEEHKKKQVEELMKKYHQLYDQGKYAEAEMAAQQAHDLDPDDSAAAAAVSVAHMHRNLTKYQKIKNGKENMVVDGLDDAEDEGPHADVRNPLKFDQETWERAQKRKGLPKEGWNVLIKSEKELEIERRLSLPISLDFKNQSLDQVLKDLRDMTGINIVPDMPALEAENISLDRPVTMHLEGVSTKSALELVLHQAHLIYVIKKEVILVTTEAFSRGKLVPRTYSVADLIIPVDNHTVPVSESWSKTMEQLSTRQGPGAIPSTPTPYTGGKTLTNGTPVGAGVSAQSSSSSSNPPTTGEADPANTHLLVNQLIKTITTTIQPTSWDVMGGPGTIEYYPLGMALVISQTPDIQEQVADLLAALRRLQDLEVTVEVRFITLSEAFYERIGMDFNINIQAQNTKYEPLIVSQQFAPPGFNNVFRPSSFVTGLVPGGSTPPGVFTHDLNIPIINSSFTPAIPPFGGFPNTLGSDGGLSLGLAFLSDIQVFLFMEAAQADRRTNVMQAPKLTLFNGASATITVGTTQFFVTQVATFQVNGQVIFSPTNTGIPLNLSLGLQAVVSADRRFVRLNLNPELTNLASPTTALFPVTTFITPVFDNGAQGQPVPFTQYIQQPVTTHVSIQTSVNIPDGGTVVLGGLKTLREGRNEFGPPILSKLPYVNRLFKNVGYGREAESLLIMVTPRVIINEEEEELQTGERRGLPAGVAGGGEIPPPGPGIPAAGR